MANCPQDVIVPVILVPGIMGSRLRVKDSKDEVVWDPDDQGVMLRNYGANARIVGAVFRADRFRFSCFAIAVLLEIAEILKQKTQTKLLLHDIQMVGKMIGQLIGKLTGQLPGEFIGQYVIIYSGSKTCGIIQHAQ